MMAGKDVLEYRGFQGSIEIDLKNEFLHGKIWNIASDISYKADTLKELKTAFAEKVDKYLQRTDAHQYKVGDKVIVTIDVLHNKTGKEFEAVITELEQNPFRGLVLYVDAREYGTFFDVADRFKIVQ